MSNPWNTSGNLTQDTVVTTTNAKLHSIMLIADGTNAASAIIYDSTTTSGTVVARIAIPATGTYAAHIMDCGVICNNGLSVDLTGTGAACVVHWTTS